MRARRYQIKKDAAAIIERGHPWLFRDQLSTAADVFGDGDWLRLVDGHNKVVAHGIYEAEGAIAIRIVRRGAAAPDGAWFAAQLAAALAKRQPLVGRTDGIRLINGESDGIPAIAIDRFGEAIVIASYSGGVDAIARFLGRTLARTTQHRDVIGPATSITLRPGRRRQTPGEARTLYAKGSSDGSLGDTRSTGRFTEDGLTYAVDLAEGHKTGAYLDLRGLRHDLATAALAGARVLNLFSYTGMLARAAEAGGATQVISVDTSARALAFAAQYNAPNAPDAERHQFVEADVFAWLPAHPETETYDLVIVDPPSMTSHKAAVPGALNAYRKLYKAAARHVRPNGAIVAACCTSRIERAQFHHVVSEALGHRFKKTRELTPEIDHPVGFPQADYLKIAWWRRTQ